MARVLLAWELGFGFGHVVPLRRLADALADRGHACILAGNNLSEVAPALADGRHRLVQAPTPVALPDPLRRRPPAVSLTEILHEWGFGETEALLALCRAWESLLDALAPDVAVCEYAPVLSLVAQDRLPHVLVGTGFTVPPAALPSFPRFRERPAAVEAEAVLAVVNRVQARRDRPPLTDLGDLFRPASRWVLTPPLLDVFAAHRSDERIGPLAPPPPPARAAGSGVFAYLAADAPETPRLAHALALAGVPAEAFVRGAGPEERRELARRGVTVHDRPPALAERLAERAVLLHHGGQGAAQVALGRGRPQLLAPRYGEQRLTAERLERLGAGRTLDPGQPVDTLAESIARAAADADLAAAAAGLARDVAADPPRPALAALVSEIERLAGSPVPGLPPPALLAEAVFPAVGPPAAPAEAGAATGADAAPHAAMLADVLALMADAPFHRGYSVADLRRLILPPIRLGQCRVYRRRGRPVGFVTWAWLTAEAEAGFLDGTRKLQPADWRAGDRLWFVDFAAAPGMAPKMVADLTTRLFPDAEARSIRRGADGRFLRVCRWTGRGRRRAPGRDRKAPAAALAEPVSPPP